MIGHGGRGASHFEILHESRSRRGLASGFQCPSSDHQQFGQTLHVLILLSLGALRCVCLPPVNKLVFF